MADASFLLFPNQASHRRKEGAQAGIPADGGLGPNPASQINRGDVSDDIDVIDGEDAKTVGGEFLKLGAFGNVVGKNDGGGRIVPQDFLRRGVFEGAGEAGVVALAEVNQFPARRRSGSENRGRDRAQVERLGPAPFFKQVVEYGGASAKRHGLAREAAMSRGV